MATNTPNLNLVKPEMSDYADIRVINKNMDIIDNAINKIMTGGTGLPGLPALPASTYLKDVTASEASITFTKNDGSHVNVPLNYLPLTGGTVSGRTHFDHSMLSVGQSSEVANNIRVDGAAGNAYIALLNYNNTNSLSIDGYFNNPETAVIDVTNRDKNGTVRYKSTLMDGKGNAKFANEVYAKGKLLATKEYVDSKNLGSTSIADGSITPTKLDRAYLPLTGGTLTGSLSIDGGNNIVHYIGPGGGTAEGNLNLGDATKTKSTALCCINRPMWWNNTLARNLALEEDLNTHNASRSAHADIREKITSDINAHNSSNSAHADIRAKITSDINAHNSSGTSHADIRRMFNNYLPLTGGTVSGRTHFDHSMLSVGQSSEVANNIRVDGAAGNAYIALLNYNNTNSLSIDGYFNNPETAVIDVTNRDKNGTVRYKSTLMDGKGNAKFANEVYAKGKLLATKEYVDSKNLGSTSIADGSITPTKLDRAYLPLTGGNVTGDLTVNEKTLVYVLEKIVDDTNEKYKITAIKYSDGTLKQIVTSKIESDNVFTTVTFLVPFTNVDDIILSSGLKLPATNEYKLPSTGQYKSVADLSTTGAKFHFANAHMYWDYTFIGYWK